MTETPASRRLWRAGAVLWLLAVLACVAHNVWLWGVQEPALNTDILALLPQDRRDPVAEAALARMAEAGERRVVVLVGAGAPERTRAAADAFAAALQGAPLTLTYRVDAGRMDAWKSFFASYRTSLLDEAQLDRLRRDAPEHWQRQAMDKLLSPAPAAGLPWRDDPFGLFDAWLLDQARTQRVRAVDGRLWLETGGRGYAVLMLSLHDSPLAGATQERILPALERARAAARRAAPDAEIAETGVVHFAAAASRQAQAEMSTIGLGSTLGLVVLVLLVFRRIRPLLLALAPIAVGTLAAISATVLVFGQVHAVTLVFGASLVGVAEDYGIHYLTMGYAEERFDPFGRMRRLLGGLSLAMVTTVIAYCGLALTPFPGLRQMALFAGVGLVAAWLSAVLWLPWLARPLPPLAGLGRHIAASRPFWASLLQGPRGVFLLLAAGVVLALGLGRVEFKDDLRLLQNAPPELVRQQARVAGLLQLPSPTQFYVVRGDSIEQTLRREEALRRALDAERARGTISAYQALSAQVPSAARQQASQAALRAAYARTLPALAAEVGADSGWVEKLQAPAAPLTLERWLADPASEPWRHLWLGGSGDGYASVVTLSGIEGPAALARLAALEQDGVRWVDKPAQISSLMAHYRDLMLFVILGSAVAVYALLRRRYGPRAWRGLAPTLLAGLLTVAILGLIGEPVQLFTLLGLFLVLGMGEDYGIFMLEHPRAEDGPSWLAVTMAAITTLLSFGLLAFSQTPALHAFGLATLIGIGASWLLAPAFQSPVSVKGTH